MAIPLRAAPPEVLTKGGFVFYAKLFFIPLRQGFGGQVVFLKSPYWSKSVLIRANG